MNKRMEKKSGEDISIFIAAKDVSMLPLPDNIIEQ
jgi:hypothetical protein